DNAAHEARDRLGGHRDGLRRRRAARPAVAGWAVRRLRDVSLRGRLSRRGGWGALSRRGVWGACDGDGGTACPPATSLGARDDGRQGFLRRFAALTPCAWVPGRPVGRS